MKSYISPYNDFSTASNSPTAPFQFSHSASPPGIPPTSGNLVPSLSPNPNTLETASLIPTVPNLTTSSSTALILYCSVLASLMSSAVLPSLRHRSYRCTTDLGKNPALPSIVPAHPNARIGRSCCPSPVKVWKWLWSIDGFAPIWAWYEISP
jgi:hypothetical protein